MPRLWGRANSINVQKASWLIAELGLAAESVPAGGPFGRLDEPTFLALNPHGRIPVLEDGAVAVWESHAILRYLAARDGGAFWPAEPAARAPIDAWMDWAQTDLQPAFIGGVFWGYYRTPPAQRDWPAIRASLARCATLFGRLDDALSSRPYLAGDTLTLADIPAGALLYRWFELDIDRPALPHLERWYGRLSERRAYRDTVMTPFADLEGRLSF